MEFQRVGRWGRQRLRGIIENRGGGSKISGRRKRRETMSGAANSGGETVLRGQFPPYWDY